MPDAARLGDQMNHGGTIGPVVTGTTVLIGYQPAACMGDAHVCPVSDGPKPHVGGTILKGSATVLICNKPAARVGDAAECKGPPNSIAMGCSTVQIGDAGGGGGGGGGEGSGGGGPGGGGDGGGEGGESGAATSEAATAPESSSGESSGTGASGGGQSEQPTQQEQNTDLRVTVTDQATGQPISGARVALSGAASPQAGSTDAQGVARFTGIAPGSYRVEASKSGYVTGRTSATVARGTPSTAAVALQPLVLEITDAAGTVLTGTQTKIVGQKIQLRVRVRPAGQTMSNIRWTIPTQTVKSYSQTGAAGTKTDLAAPDLQVNSIGFYWLDGGNKVVRVTATVGGSNLSASVTFNVLRPTVNHFTITVSSVNVTSNHFASPGSPVLTAFDPGPPRRFGSQWDAQVTAPAGGAGQVGFTQRILVNRTRSPNAGADQHFSSGGQFILDGDLGIQYSGPQAIAAGGSTTLNGAAYADSPATPLTADLRAKSANESFELYLMYKPAGADSIWVTLSKGTWGWAGSTTRTGAPASAANVWTPAAGASMPSSNGADSTTLPVWTAQFSSIAWV